MKNIHDDIEDWHDSPTDTCPLHIFLGMTWEAYGRWVTGKMSAEELASLGYYDA